MITISEYLHYLFSEVSNARASADAESVRIAKIYAKDELLKHFPVPRFKTPELEMSIPIGVSKVDVDTLQAKLDLTKTVAETVRIFTTALIELKAKLVFADVVFDELRKNFQTFWKEAVEIDAQERSKKIESVFPEWLQQAAKLGRVEQKPEIIKQYQTLVVERIIDYCKKNETQIDSGKLKKILITPETNRINAEASNELSIFTIKAKFIEEGFYLNTVRDADGNEKVVVNFE